MSEVKDGDEYGKQLRKRCVFTLIVDFYENKVALCSALRLARPYFRPPARGLFLMRSVGRPPSRGADLSAYTQAHTPGHRTRTSHTFYMLYAHSVLQISLTSRTKCHHIKHISNLHRIYISTLFTRFFSNITRILEITYHLMRWNK